MYADYILRALPAIAREALLKMDASKYQYQSDFARGYLEQGIAQGAAEGRSSIALKQLAIRYGPLSAEVEARVKGSSAEELETIAERLLTAPTLEQALGEV